MSRSRLRSRLTEMIGPLSIVALFSLMVWISWRRWPDLLIDFGLQLYVPWQISEGQVLYRDVAYLTGGPLSQLYHSILFSLFGTSFTVLILSNLVLLVFLIFLLYERYRSASDTLTAIVVALAVVLAFAFAQYGDIGNYNFVSPYSHEAIHGLFLSICCLALLSSPCLGKGKPALAGICYGGVFLTKPELFLALNLCLASYGMFCWWISNLPRLRKISLFLGSALLLPSLCFVYFFRHESALESLRHVVWAWVPLLTTSAAKNPFYQWCLGLDTPWLHLRMALMHFGVLFLAVGFLIWRCRKLPANPAQRSLFVCMTGMLVLGAVFFDWTTSGRALPLLVIVAILLHVWSSQVRPDPAQSFPLLMAFFGLFLLAKLGFHSRIWHYGFYLALPASLTAVYLLTWQLPSRLKGYSIQSQLVRGVICLVLLVGFAQLAAQSNNLLQQKTFSIGLNGDRLLTKKDSSAENVLAALSWIETNAAPHETLAVLPEGALINYLSRRPNPTPYMNFNPAEIAAFGEEVMLKAYVQNPPDYVVLVHRESGEFGVDYFGKDPNFGRAMMDWVATNYKPVHLIGYEPLKNGLFGIKILKRTRANQ